MVTFRPGVECDVVVAVSGGEEGGLVSPAFGDVEAEDSVVEGEVAFEVGDFEVDVADTGVGGWWACGPRGWDGVCVCVNSSP